jgi:aryl-alcohol dehydrogenase-like predicted oxidoreductase
MYGMILNDVNFDLLEKFEDFAIKYNHTIAELAIAWLVSHPWISTVIAGVTKPEQVSANVAAANWGLTANEMAELDKAINYRPYFVFPPKSRTYTLAPGYLNTV